MLLKYNPQLNINQTTNVNNQCKQLYHSYCLFVVLFICCFVYLLLFCLFVVLFICCFVYLLFCLFVVLFICYFVYCDPQDDWSALMLATKNGHEAIVRYLVEHGSNVSYKKKVGLT